MLWCYDLSNTKYLAMNLKLWVKNLRMNTFLFDCNDVVFKKYSYGCYCLYVIVVYYNKE